MVRLLVGLLLALAQAPVPVQAQVAAPVASAVAFVGLSVRDRDVTAAWYEKHLGCRVEPLPQRDASARAALLHCGALLIEAMEHSRAAPLAWYAPQVGRNFEVHGVFKFGLFVPDLDARLAAMRAAGAQVRGTAIAVPEQGMRFAFVTDPDDNRIQLFERIAPAPAPPR